MPRLALHIIAIGALLASLLVSGAAPNPRAPRLLLIGVDAIPYDVVRELTDPARGEAALFRGMTRPTALINAYPTNSYVAWTGLLAPFGIGKSEGYESRYLDRRTGTVTDGYDLKDPPAPWKDFFDYRLHGVIPAAIAYGWPRYYSLKELDDGLRDFAQSDSEIFSMYIISTDAVGHLFGPPAQADFMRALDKRLQTLRRRERSRPFHVVMFSDHGMAGGQPLQNTWPAIKDAVAQAGYRLGNRLEHERDAVFIPYGLLSSFIVYSKPTAALALARTVTAVDGVDLCVLRDREAHRVVSRRGEALVRQRHHVAGTQWSYEMLRGDPLGYGNVLATLRGKSGHAGASWFADRDWFMATARHAYPDALYRIGHAFDLVRNPSSLVCSMSPGYMFGGLLAEYVAIPTIGPLKWTHGALHREASLGFLMTDIPGWPEAEAVRYDEALAPLRARYGQRLAHTGHHRH